jgi:type IV secretory pathway VirB10-like protein
MSEPESRRNRLVLITIGAVVVLAVVGVVVYLLTQPDSDEASNPDVPTISDEAPPPSPQSPPSVSDPPAGNATGEVTAPPPPDDDQQAAARTVAEDAIDAINTQNVDAMSQLACDPDSVGQAEDLTPGVTARLRENPTINGDEATVQLELLIEGIEPTVVDLTLEKRQDGSWCVP